MEHGARTLSDSCRYSHIIAVFVQIKLNGILSFQRISADLKQYRKFRKVRYTSDKLRYPQRLAEKSENQVIYLRKKIRRRDKIQL